MLILDYMGEGMGGLTLLKYLSVEFVFAPAPLQQVPSPWAFK